MKYIFPRKSQLILLLGDTVVLYFLILLGFSIHRIEDSAGSRFAITLLPFLLAWIIAASVLRQYDPRWTGRRSDLWRVLPAAALAALAGAFLRAPLVGTPVQPTFILVMAAMIALGMFLWRLVYVSIIAPRLRLNE